MKCSVKQSQKGKVLVSGHNWTKLHYCKAFQGQIHYGKIQPWLRHGKEDEEGSVGLLVMHVSTNSEPAKLGWVEKGMDISRGEHFSPRLIDWQLGNVVG